MAAHNPLAASMLVLVFSLPVAKADRIVLVNGDRLTGKVVSKAEDTLKFHTEYAGDIKVLWKDVVSITTDDPVTVLSPEGELRTGRLESTTFGEIALVTQDGSREVTLSDLEHINPPPHVAGTGVTYRGARKPAGERIAGQYRRQQPLWRSRVECTRKGLPVSPLRPGRAEGRGGRHHSAELLRVRAPRPAYQ